MNKNVVYNLFGIHLLFGSAYAKLTQNGANEIIKTKSIYAKEEAEDICKQINKMSKKRNFSIDKFLGKPGNYTSLVTNLFEEIEELKNKLFDDKNEIKITKDMGITAAEYEQYKKTVLDIYNTFSARVEKLKEYVKDPSKIDVNNIVPVSEYFEPEEEENPANGKKASAKNKQPNVPVRKNVIPDEAPKKYEPTEEDIIKIQNLRILSHKMKSFKYDHLYYRNSRVFRNMLGSIDNAIRYFDGNREFLDEQQLKKAFEFVEEYTNQYISGKKYNPTTDVGKGRLKLALAALHTVNPAEGDKMIDLIATKRKADMDTVSDVYKEQYGITIPKEEKSFYMSLDEVVRESGITPLAVPVVAPKAEAVAPKAEAVAPKPEAVAPVVKEEPKAEEKKPVELNRVQQAMRKNGLPGIKEEEEEYEEEEIVAKAPVEEKKAEQPVNEPDAKEENPKSEIDKEYELIKPDLEKYNTEGLVRSTDLYKGSRDTYEYAISVLEKKFEANSLTGDDRLEAFGQYFLFNDFMDRLDKIANEEFDHKTENEMSDMNCTFINCFNLLKRDPKYDVINRKAFYEAMDSIPENVPDSEVYKAVLETYKFNVERDKLNKNSKYKLNGIAADEEYEDYDDFVQENIEEETDQMKYTDEYVKITKSLQKTLNDMRAAAAGIIDITKSKDLIARFIIAQKAFISVKELESEEVNDYTMSELEKRSNYTMSMYEQADVIKKSPEFTKVLNEYKNEENIEDKLVTIYKSYAAEVFNAERHNENNQANNKAEDNKKVLEQGNASKALNH